MVKPIELAPGVELWREYFGRTEQKSLVEQVLSRAERTPFYRPVMPRSGKPFSVQETNFGPLGWVSDINGYRYSRLHPQTGESWADIPDELLHLWNAIAHYRYPPECCLVNFYQSSAKMGLHQDRDEEAIDAPVISASLGDDALFQFGGVTRNSSKQKIQLSSGDVLTFGGPARLMFHGIDRLVSGSSTLVPGGGRLNLTLRRVTRPIP